MPALPADGRHDLPDHEWSVIEPLLPRGRKAGRPPKWPKRQLIDGTWKALLTALQALADVAGHVTWDVSVDSATARAQQHAAGARKNPAGQKEPPGGRGTPEPGDHALGRSRGGLTSKFHLACEQRQKPLAIIVTAGQRGDSPHFTAVLEAIRVPRPGGGRPRARPDRVLADKAYGSRANRAWLRARHIRCTIPEKTDQIRNRKNKGSSGGRRPAFDKEKYKQRHAVECGINRTSSPSATKPPSTSPPSANGSGPSLLKHALILTFKLISTRIV